MGQMNECEALESILMDDMEIKSNTCPRCYCISVVPYYEGEDNINYVGCKVTFTLPESYPEIVPDFVIENMKGLSEEKINELKNHLDEIADAYIGMPMIFNIVEECKTWLQDNNGDQNAP